MNQHASSCLGLQAGMPCTCVRVECVKCHKTGGVMNINGAEWHWKCFNRASLEEKAKHHFPGLHPEAGAPTSHKSPVEAKTAGVDPAKEKE